MKKRLGFTMVELLIYMGLLAILLVVVTEIFLAILDLQSKSTAVSSVAQDGKYLLARLTYDVRRATSMTTPSSIGQATTTTQLVINGATNTYNGSTGDLVITNSNGSDNLTSVGSKISNLSFQRLGNVGGKNSLLIRFTLTSSQSLTGGKEVRDYETTVSLR